MTGLCIAVTIFSALGFVLGLIGLIMARSNVRADEEERENISSAELGVQTLTASEIMSLSDVTKPEIEAAIVTLRELGVILSDNGDSRVEVTNAAVELLGDILREAEKRA